MSVGRPGSRVMLHGCRVMIAYTYGHNLFSRYIRQLKKTNNKPQINKTMENENTTTPIQIADIVKGTDFCDFKTELTEEGGLSMQSVGKVVENIFKACGVSYTKKVGAVIDDDADASKHKMLCHTIIYQSKNFVEGSGSKFMVVLDSIHAFKPDVLDIISYNYSYDTQLIVDEINSAREGDADAKKVESRCYEPEPFIFVISDYIQKRLDEEGLEVSKESVDLITKASIESDQIVTMILCGIFTSLRRMAVMDVQHQVIKLINSLGGHLDVVPPSSMNKLIDERKDDIRNRAEDILAKAKAETEASKQA